MILTIDRMLDHIMHETTIRTNNNHTQISRGDCLNDWRENNTFYRWG